VLFRFAHSPFELKEKAMIRIFQSASLFVAAFALAALAVLHTARAESDHVVYAFCANTSCTDGQYPVGVLKTDSHNNFYGTTFAGGNTTACPANSSSPAGCGTVFELPSGGGEKVFYIFKGGSDGYGPWGEMSWDSKGNLYGKIASKREPS
jgi:hypothetical protein